MTALTALFGMLCSHAIADYMLQTPWVAQNKNRHAAGGISGYDPKLHGPKQTTWPYVLMAHALTHGAGVGLVTGSVFLGLAETLAHFWIDFLKCERLFGIHVDQALHIACKLLWLAFVVVR